MGPDTVPAAFPMVQPVPLASGASEWSSLLATVLGLAFMMGLAFIILFNRWNRPDLDTEHAVHILTQLNTFGGTRRSSVVVRSVDALDDGDVIQEIRGLFHGESSSEPTVTSASREVMSEVRAELHARAPPVSKVPVRAVQEAILTAMFGAVAILPMAVWREAAETGGGGVPSVADILAVLSGGMDAAVSVLTAFPMTDALFALGLTAGILGAELIWTTWFLPPVVLMGLAVAYWWLEREVETDRDLTGPPVSGWARRFLTLAVVTWLTGTFLAAIGGVLPFQPFAGVLIAITAVAVYVYLTRDPLDVDESPDFVTDGGERENAEDDASMDRLFPPRNSGEDAETGLETLAKPVPEDEDRGEPTEDGEDDDEPERRPLRDHVRGVNWKRAAFIGVLTLGFAHQVLAFIAALAVSGVVTARWLGRTLYRWRMSAERDGQDAFALDVVHSLTVTAAALTLPLTAGYATLALGTGKAFAVAGTILSAPPSTLYAVLILAVVVALAVTVTFASRFRDVRRGIRRAMSVQAVRSVVFARALPFALMVVVGILALSFGVSPVGVVAVTLAVGFLARFAFMAYNYVTYRTHQYDGRDSAANRVVINGRKVTDADGEPVFVADVNGHRTAHRRLDPLINQIRRDGRSLMTEGEPETGSFPRYYYQNGVIRGKVDMEAVADELLGDVRTRFIANVKQTDATASDIREKLRDEYPDSVVQRVVSDLKQRGRVSEREDSFLWLG